MTERSEKKPLIKKYGALIFIGVIIKLSMIDIYHCENLTPCMSPAEVISLHQQTWVSRGRVEGPSFCPSRAIQMLPIMQSDTVPSEDCSRASKHTILWCDSWLHFPSVLHPAVSTTRPIGVPNFFFMSAEPTGKI